MNILSWWQISFFNSARQNWKKFGSFFCLQTWSPRKLAPWLYLQSWPGQNALGGRYFCFTFVISFLFDWCLFGVVMMKKLSVFKTMSNLFRRFLWSYHVCFYHVCGYSPLFFVFFTVGLHLSSQYYLGCLSFAGCLFPTISLCHWGVVACDTYTWIKPD